MKPKELIKLAKRFSKPFRITDGASFRLKDIDPGDTLDLGYQDKPRAKEALDMGIEALTHLQDKLYADISCAVLVIFICMDYVGRDSTIKHVMSGDVLAG